MHGYHIDNPLLRPHTAREMCEDLCGKDGASEEALGRLPVSWTQPDNDPHWEAPDRDGISPLCDLFLTWYS